MEEQTVKQRSIVVLGAGVIGLTIAHVLSEDPANWIIIVARDMPENLDSQGFSSPWAGANWSPVGAYDERQYKREKFTFDKLWSMIPSGLVMELPSRQYGTATALEDASNPWWKGIVRNFRVLPAKELIPEANYGFAFTTLSARPARYLHWIKAELVQRGVRFVQKNVGSIGEAAALGGDDSILINAAGLGAKGLLGVEDESVHPIRGQTIIVKAPHVKEFVNSTIHGEGLEPDEATYIIPREDGTAILGGTFQSDNWELAVNHRTARRIFERCTSLEPTLLPSQGTTILSHNVGLRPARRGGPRVEIETVQLPLPIDLVPSYEGLSKQERRLTMIHAYGFGPTGYQASWGVAEEVASLLAKV